MSEEIAYSASNQFEKNFTVFKQIVIYQVLVPTARNTARLNTWPSIVYKLSQWSTKCLRVSVPSLIADDMNHIYRQNSSWVVFAEKKLEKIPK